MNSEEVERSVDRWDTFFTVAGVLIWWLTFLATWIACAANYGFLFGFGLGWLPAYILASIVTVTAFLWVPLLLLALCALAVMVLK